jgi:hypothetical protein
MTAAAQQKRDYYEVLGIDRTPRRSKSSKLIVSWR